MKFIKSIKKIFSFVNARYLHFRHFLRIIFCSLKIELDFNFNKSSIKVAHIYASEGFKNSGDFLLGIATKWYFSKKLLKEKKIIFHNFNCRDSKVFNNKNVNKLNRYDYLLIGGGGLILPDAASNKISGWQWNISIENLKKIRVPIYVMSIGYNLFYGQSIDMQDNKSNVKTKYILNTFKKHITTLIKKSSYFSLRHKGDIKELLKVIGPEYKNKIIFQPCPTIEYIKNKWKSKNKKDKRIFTAIEVKDDREWRRYYKIGKDKYYSKLLKWVQIKIRNGNEFAFYNQNGILGIETSAHIRRTLQLRSIY